MKIGEQLQPRKQNWNIIDLDLSLWVIGLFLLTVGVTLKGHLNLVLGTVIGWSGIIVMLIAAAMFTAILQVELGDDRDMDSFPSW